MSEGAAGAKGSGRVVRVYLDNCCFNRPFDDQSQARIRLEAEAKLCIQREIREGRIELAWSYMADLENTANPFEERRTTIAAWRESASIDIEESRTVLEKAQVFVATGMKPKDGLHVACAISAGCEYFITTDDRILALASEVGEIRIVDPTAFIREMDL